MQNKNWDKIEEELKNLRLTFYLSTEIRGNPAMEIKDEGIGVLTMESVNRLKQLFKKRGK